MFALLINQFKLLKNIMKKIMFGAAVLAAFSLASCKKADRVCECTYPNGGGSDKVTYVDKMSKKTAKFLCEGDSKVDIKTEDGTFSYDPSADEDAPTCVLK